MGEEKGILNSVGLNGLTLNCNIDISLQLKMLVYVVSYLKFILSYY